MAERTISGAAAGSWLHRHRPRGVRGEEDEVDCVCVLLYTYMGVGRVCVNVRLHSTRARCVGAVLISPYISTRTDRPTPIYIGRPWPHRDGGQHAAGRAPLALGGDRLPHPLQGRAPQPQVFDIYKRCAGNGDDGLLRLWLLIDLGPGRFETIATIGGQGCIGYTTDAPANIHTPNTAAPSRTARPCT